MTQQPPPPPPPAAGGPPPWQQPPPAQHAQPAKSGLRSRWWFIPGIAGAALIVGLAIGGSGGSSSSAKSGPAATVTAAGPTSTATVQVTTTPTKVIATRTVQVRVTYTPPPVDETTDGQYIVGSEIRAGTWHTDDTDCYYARLADLNGGLYSIIDNDNTGPATILIKASDKAIKFSGGCTWRKIG